MSSVVNLLLEVPEHDSLHAKLTASLKEMRGLQKELLSHMMIVGFGFMCQGIYSCLARLWV